MSLTSTVNIVIKEQGFTLTDKAAKQEVIEAMEAAGYEIYGLIYTRGSKSDLHMTFTKERSHDSE